MSPCWRPAGVGKWKNVSPWWRPGHEIQPPDSQGRSWNLWKRWILLTGPSAPEDFQGEYAEPEVKQRPLVEMKCHSNDTSVLPVNVWLLLMYERFMYIKVFFVNKGVFLMKTNGFLLLKCVFYEWKCVFSKSNSASS